MERKVVTVADKLYNSWAIGMIDAGWKIHRTQRYGRQAYMVWVSRNIN